jgi:hypothetical protein
MSEGIAVTHSDIITEATEKPAVTVVDVCFDATSRCCCCCCCELIRGVHAPISTTVSWVVAASVASTFVVHTTTPSSTAYAPLRKEFALTTVVEEVVDHVNKC